MANTNGFYRVQDNELQYAPNRVHAPDYNLKKKDRDTYTYPTPGGWVWFDTEDDARTYFNLPAAAVATEDDPVDIEEQLLMQRIKDLRKLKKRLNQIPK